MSEQLSPNFPHEANASLTGEIACVSCGASLKFKPGTEHLACDYCGAQNEIPHTPREIVELDFDEYIAKFETAAPHTGVKTLQCKNCSASTTLPPNVTSMSCAYCATPLILEQSKEEYIITPHGVLPFKLDRNAASLKFGSWLKGLWFAPNKLKKMSLDTNGLKGLYTPYWTYDSDTESYYVGQRGTWHYRTVTYTAVENGKSVQRSRQERYTIWHTVTGTVQNVFDDILVNASNSLPRNYTDELEPWPLGEVKPFVPEFLSGFLAEKYQVDLKNGFSFAKGKMDNSIRNSIHRDIGGDEQRIVNVSTDYRNVTFKHMLLPIYISAYPYNGKVYRFVVNGATGKVKGERPWSVWKIVLAVLAGLLLISILFAIFQ